MIGAPDPRAACSGGVSAPVRVTLGLGSNVGDRAEQLRRAVELIEARQLLDLDLVSPIVASEGLTLAGFDAAAPPYLNQVVQGWWCPVLQGEPAAGRVPAALELLDALQRIETDCGRDRGAEGRWGARPLDVDILDIQGWTLDDPRLQLPHPRIRERVFVLKPWADIAPDDRLTASAAASAADEEGVAPTIVELLAAAEQQPGQGWTRPFRPVAAPVREGGNP